ncbi:MAG: hypothetical protein ACREBR_05635 [bacterium]
MDLKSFSNLNRVEKEFEIVNGLKISMHTLSVLQQQQALAELPTSPLGMDAALRAVILQQALLIYAIDSINGTKVTVQEAKEFIQNSQAPIFNAIYNCYDQMAQEQDQTLEELKKKVI